MINLVGTYECKIDAKGRVMLPSALKKQLSPVIGEGFVLKRSERSCLELYPMSEWNACMGKMKKLNRFKQKNKDFIRLWTAGAKMVEVDSSGRLLVAKDLVGYAGLQKQIVISTAIDILEIWDKDRYEEAINESSIDLAELAEDVMGDDYE